MRLALLLALVGCVAPERTETGPTVKVRLAGSASPITNETPDPAITLRSTETMYSITMTIETRDGEREEDGSFDRFPVTRVEATAAVPDVALPAIAFEDDGPYFDATAPLAIPATAKGKLLHVTARGFDARGLSSNVVEFDVALR